MKDENSHPPSHTNNDEAIRLLNCWENPVPVFPRWVLLIHEMDHYADVAIYKAGRLERLHERIALHVLLQKWNASGIVQINKSYAVNVLRFNYYNSHLKSICFDQDIIIPLKYPINRYAAQLLHDLKHCRRRGLS